MTTLEEHESGSPAAQTFNEVLEAYNECGRIESAQEIVDRLDRYALECSFAELKARSEYCDLEKSNFFTYMQTMKKPPFGSEKTVGMFFNYLSLFGENIDRLLALFQDADLHSVTDESTIENQFEIVSAEVARLATSKLMISMVREAQFSSPVPDPAGWEKHLKKRKYKYERESMKICSAAVSKALTGVSSRIDDELRARRVREELGIGLSSQKARRLPPLVEVLNNASARKAILLTEEFLPGFFGKSKGGAIDSDLSDKQKALFISLISNKKHGTYKRAFSELNQASYQSSEYRDDKEWARQQAARLIGTDEE